MLLNNCLPFRQNMVTGLSLEIYESISVKHECLTSTIYKKFEQTGFIANYYKEISERVTSTRN